MKKIHYYYLFIIISLMAACSQKVEDTPDENYWHIFQVDSTAIDSPVHSGSYENMFKTPCDPEVDENNFVYPNITLKGENRNYTVTLKIFLKEVDTYDEKARLHSDFFVRYVNEEKKLISLQSKELFGQLEYRNGASVEFSYKAQSGYPMYLGIIGGGSGRFNLKASMQAVSEDKLITTPELKFDFYKSFDGLGDIDPPYCEKIILP